MKWIPTSERLPSERGEYLVTVDFEGDTYVECFHYGKPIMANREVKDECFYDSDDEWGDVVYDTGTEVIAWMPLPEPYKADRKTEPTGDKLSAVDKDINVRSKDEPQRDDIGNCNICKYVGLEHRCNQCVNGSMFCKVEDEPQTDCSWR